MKKIFMVCMVLLFAGPLFAQKVPKEVDPEIKELQIARDTARALVRLKNLENNKDLNRYDKLLSEKVKLKDQYNTAKKGKKTDKMDAIQDKITENAQNSKDLDLKLKEENKELDQLDKDLKNAEKALQRAKDAKAKEKSKK